MLAPYARRIGHDDFFADSGIPAVLLDLEGGAVLRCNGAAAELTGTPADQVEGRPIGDFLTDASGGDVLGRLRSQDGPTRVSGRVRTGTGWGTVELVVAPSGVPARSWVQVVDVGEWQDALAHRVAHDLRSPLASAMGMVDLIRQRFDELEPEVRADLLDRASNALRSLSEQVTGLVSDSSPTDRPGR